MDIVDFIFNWLLPWIFCVTLVVWGFIAVFFSVFSKADKHVKLALLLSGVAVILTCGDRLEILYEGYKPIKPTVKEIRV